MVFFLSLGYNWANVSLQQLTISATIFTICPTEALEQRCTDAQKLPTSGDLPRTELMTPKVQDSNTSYFQLLANDYQATWPFFVL